MAHMLQCLFYHEAKSYLTQKAVHVTGVDNRVADTVSKNNPDVLFDLVPQVLESHT